MVKKSLDIAFFLALAYSIPSTAAEEAIHLKIKEIAKISNHAGNGLTLPKVFIFSQSGGLLLDSEVRQSPSGIVSLLEKADAKPDNSPSPLREILAVNGVKPPYGALPLLVIISSGSSLKRCSACDSYNEELSNEMSASKTNVRVVHIYLESND